MARNGQLFRRRSRIDDLTGVLECALRPATAPHLPGADLVMGDAEEPGAEGIAAVDEARKRGQRVGEDLLGGIRGVVPVAEAIEAVAEHVVAIALVERSEGPPFPARGGDQVGVAVAGRHPLVLHPWLDRQCAHLGTPTPRDHARCTQENHTR
jgi:hypothetical protein